MTSMSEAGRLAGAAGTQAAWLTSSEVISWLTPSDPRSEAGSGAGAQTGGSAAMSPSRWSAMGAAAEEGSVVPFGEVRRAQSSARLIRSSSASPSGEPSPAAEAGTREAAGDGVGSVGRLGLGTGGRLGIGRLGSGVGAAAAGPSSVSEKYFSREVPATTDFMMPLMSSAVTSPEMGGAGDTFTL